MELRNCRGEYLIFLSRLLDALVMDFYNGHQIMLIGLPHLDVDGSEVHTEACWYMW